MQTESHVLSVVILLAAAVLVVALFKRLRLSPVLGYLVAGALIGEFGMRLLRSEDVSQLAHFGVVLLLFSIGLEMTLERLLSMRWQVFALGALQVILTSVVAAYILEQLHFSLKASIIMGGALALSSTAMVMRVIEEKHLMSSKTGRIALATLLLQDFIVVPLLVLVPLFAKETPDLGWTVAMALGRAALALVVIFIVGRMVLRPLFDLIAATHSEELFIATTLLLVLGMAWVTETMELSLALGAFIAGMLVAETRYHHRVEEIIKPFKALLMGLFFMSVGMTLDTRAILSDLPLIMALTCLLLSVKSLLIIMLCKAFRYSWKTAIKSGLLLAQGSEFAFVITNLAAGPGMNLLPQESARLVMVVVTISMALTPFLAELGRWCVRKMEAAEQVSNDVTEPYSDLTRHVVIAGFGHVGHMVARLLAAQKISYVAFDIDQRRVKNAHKNNFPIFQGDACAVDTWRRTGISRAKAVIVTLPGTTDIKRTARVIRKAYPDLPIVVRAQDLRHAQSLHSVGASVVIPEKYEVGLELAGSLMRILGLGELEISRLKNTFRAGNYEQMIEERGKKV